MNKNQQSDLRCYQGRLELLVYGKHIFIFMRYFSPEITNYSKFYVLSTVGLECSVW